MGAEPPVIENRDLFAGIGLTLVERTVGEIQVAKAIFAVRAVAERFVVRAATAGTRPRRRWSRRARPEIFEGGE